MNMDNLREKLSAQVPDLMMEYHVPGLSLALISAGEVSWHQEFGVQNAKTKEPIDQDTVFEAASLSKLEMA
jgi:CubicO group peptidase (beta-lactamase class C family)